MTDVIKVGKKLFSVSVVVMTIMWSMGVAALMPAVVLAVDCPTLEAGDLWKVADNSAVYLLNADMEAMYFPTSEIYHTWYEDFSGVQVIDNTCVDAYPAPTSVPLGVNYRSGSMLIKRQISPSVYVVEPGNVRSKLADEATAAALYGADWASKVRDVNDAFWPNYASEGDEVASAVPHNGMLVTVDGTTNYHVVDGLLYEVDGEPLGGVQTVAQSVLDELSMGDGTVTAASVLDDSSQLGGMPAAGDDDVAGDLGMALAANTPPAGYVAKSAYNADFAKFSFTATGGAVRVDKVVIKRDGLGADADLTAIRLYDGAAKVGSDQALNTNTHLATFKNLNWDLAAGETKTLTVKADTAASPSGTYDYLALYEVGLEGEGTVPDVLPIAGNNMQYHAVTMGVLDVDAKSTPANANLISGTVDQQVACYNFDTNSAEGFYVHSMKLTNAGTIANEDLTKMVLKEGATVLATHDGGFASNGQMTFDMTEDPYFIDKSKSKDLCVYVDIAAGIKDSLGKTIILQVAEYGDISAMGDLTKAQVVVTIDNDATFTAQSSQTMTIAQGTLTVARNTATVPVSAALIDGVEHNKLAAYKFTAGATEGAKVTRLRLTVSGANVAAADFSNFELYQYNEETGVETQIGTSMSMSGLYVTFEDTSDGLFDIAKSKNVVVHVYADVNTAAAWTDTTANVFIGATNSNLIIKAKGLESGDFLNPTDISLSSVTSDHSNCTLFSNGNNGTLALSINGDSPAATSLAKGTDDYDFAHLKLYATGEDMLVNSLTLRAYKDSNTGVTDAIETADNAITSVMLYDITDADNPVQLGTTVSSPAAGVATFNFDLTVPKDDYKILKVIADVPSAASNSYVKFAVASANVAADLSTTGAYSGVDILETGSAIGKTMTVATPTVSVSWGLTPPAQSIVTNAQAVHVATLNLTAGNFEDVKVNTIKVRVDNASAINGDSEATHATYGAALDNFMVKGIDGTQYGVTKGLTGGTPDYVQFTGISNLTVAKGTTEQVYVYTDVVTSTAGSWYFGTTATADVVGTGSVSGGAATITGSGVSTAQTVVGTATITFTKDAATEAEHLVAVGASGTGTEVEMLTLDADALYEDVDLKKLVFHYTPVSGDNSTAAFANGGVKLYQKVNNGTETLIGSTTFVSSTVTKLQATEYTAIFNITAGDLRIGKDDTNLIIVKTLFNGVSAGASAAMSPMIEFGNNSAADTDIVNAAGVSSGTTLAAGSINGATTLNVNGNNRVLYKSYPTVTHVALDTATMVSGVENEVYKFKVRADGNGNISLRQLKFNLDIVDNYTVGEDDANMAVGTFKLYRGSTNISSSVLIQKTTGVTVKATNTFVSGTGQSFYVTWKETEETIPAGSEYTYTLRATLAGFGNDSHNDYIRVRLANGDATSGELSVANDPYYLNACNKVKTLWNVVCLSDSLGVNSSTEDIIWSDRSAASHSYATGTGGTGAASSTADWFNGYFVTDTPTNYSTLTY